MNQHGTVLDECIQRYCETYTIAKPDANIKKFIKKWVSFYIIYQTNTLTDLPPPSKFSTQPPANYTEEHEECPIRDIEIAILFHFFSIHGKCIGQ